MTQPSFMLIEQDTLGPGPGAGFARSDGLIAGEVVTLTDTQPGGTTKFSLKYVPTTPYDPVSDTTSVASLAVVPGFPKQADFTPTVTASGSWRILLEHTDDAGNTTREIRIFSVRLAGFRRPAPGERSNPDANLANAQDANIIADGEYNEPQPGFPLGWPYGWNLDILAVSAPSVSSVFGRVGTVLAVLNDYAASLVDNDSGVAGATVADALDALDAASGVSSAFGRTGAVVAVLNDYLASLVDNDSSVGGATVADALDNLLAAIVPFFGDDYQRVQLASPFFTASAPPVTIGTLVTPVLTGTYRVGYGAVVQHSAITNAYILQLFNVTDAVIEGTSPVVEPKDVTNGELNYSSEEIIFTGASKTLAVQLGNTGSDSTALGSFIEFWRVS